MKLTRQKKGDHTMYEVDTKERSYDVGELNWIANNRHYTSCQEATKGESIIDLGNDYSEPNSTRLKKAIHKAIELQEQFILFY